jgi:hypothetical protein
MNGTYNYFITCSKSILYCISLSLMLMGCTTPRVEKSVETLQLGAIRFSGDTVAYKFSFKLNDITYSLARGGHLTIQAKEGINKISHVSYENIYGQKYNKNDSPRPSFREDSVLYFNFLPWQAAEIILSATSPTTLTIYSKNHLAASVPFIKPTRAWHKFVLEPTSAEVFLVSGDGEEKKIKMNCKPHENECNIWKIVVGNEPVYDDFLIRWPEYDSEIRIRAKFQNENLNITNLSPPEDSQKWLRAQVDKLSNQPERQIDFICKKKLRPFPRDYHDCVSAEIVERRAFAEAKLKEQQLKEKERRLNLINEEVSNLLLKPELKVCQIHILKGIEGGYTKFKECIAKEEEIKAAKEKYLNALSSDEGRLCQKDFKEDGAEFWNCFSRRLELTTLKKKDVVARECLEIGFELGSNGYKDCYLKLKIHLEQIAQWNRLQNGSLGSSAAQIPAAPPSAKSSGSVDGPDNSEAYFDLARRALEFSNRSNRQSPISGTLAAPPPPVRINTPNGNSFTCRMMGAAVNCR